MPASFQFPVSNFSEALHVLNPNTDLDVFENGLYVNLDDIRGNAFSRKILTQLGIVNGQYVGSGTNCADKILLTGHRGSGKSVELERIADTLKPHYLTITINIEKELVRLSTITPEDLYRLLIIKLFECLNGAQIPFDTDALVELTDIWESDRERETTSSNKQSLSAGGGIEFSMSAFIAKLKGSLTASVTADSTETEKTRQKIKANINDILRKWNTQLAEIRLELDKRGMHGVVFIIDGTEKIPYDVAQKIFVLDAPILQQVNAAIIMASPVLGIHDIHTGASYFNNQIFPMVKLDGDAKKIKVFRQILTRRVDEDALFEPGIIDCIVRKSGGSIRQMQELAHGALLSRQGERVDSEALRETLYEKGLSFWQRLDGKHKEILKAFTGDFDGGSETVREMLFSLVLLVQNGKAIINPVLQPFVDGSDNYLCAP